MVLTEVQNETRFQMKQSGVLHIPFRANTPRSISQYWVSWVSRCSHKVWYYRRKKEGAPAKRNKYAVLVWLGPGDGDCNRVPVSEILSIVGDLYPTHLYWYWVSRAPSPSPDHCPLTVLWLSRCFDCPLTVNWCFVLILKCTNWNHFLQVTRSPSPSFLTPSSLPLPSNWPQHSQCTQTNNIVYITPEDNQSDMDSETQRNSTS